jgi:hypothetical protein
MGTEQILMMVGATIAGTFFALSAIYQNTMHRNLYMALGVAGAGLIAYGYLQLAGM